MGRPGFRALAAGPLRHAELARAIPGARQKVLTETLRRLERDGLVSRTVTAGVPARVDYALTPLGGTLLPVFDAVSAWADAHMHEVDAAQAEFEATAAVRPHRRQDTGTGSAASVGQSV
ncbi:winged helix-turn-helix transcriptional regulator [Yinghuangia sp. YIM S10712]|uniref:winged helix-turn-helix transcriptional regulator n=1 Tax=Yinghuangia sp. YIM S10712 TaxID=3436930 RepID=UPI003F532221